MYTCRTTIEKDQKSQRGPAQEMVGWLIVFSVISTARSFRDSAPFTVPCEGREARFLHRPTGN